jgi:hypothetical protein
MSVGVVNKQTGDRIPTAGMPAIDNALSATSVNPVQNAIITAALADKQDKTDNSLETTAKTIVGAINEHEGDIGSLKSGLTNYELQNNINLEVPNRKNLAGNPYGVMLNSSGVFVSANVRSYIIPTNLGTITISVDDITKISDDVIRIGYCDDIPAESGTGVRVSSMTTNTYTITPNTGYKYIVVSNLLDNDYGWQDIQIELGSTATAYTPYIPSVDARLDAVESGLTNMDLLVENSGTLNITGVMSKYKQFLILAEGIVEGSQNVIGVSCIIATNSIKSAVWRNRYPMYGDVVLYAEIPGSGVSANGFIVNITSSEPQSAWVYSVKAIYGFN